MGIIIESEKIDENGLYCTQADRDNEQRIGNSFAKELLKHPEGIVCTLSESRTHPFDAYFCVNEKVVAIAELKKRNPKSDAKYDGTYLTYGIEIGKAKKLVLASSNYGIPAFFVVEWSDGIISYLHIDEVFCQSNQHRIGEMHNNKNNRACDHDQIYHIPLNEWKREVIQASVHLRKDHHPTPSR